MKKITLIACICTLAFSVVSCKKTESAALYEATATIKTATDQTCYFQIDDDTVLLPTNEYYKTNPYKKETRVHMVYYDRGDAAKPSWAKASVCKSGEVAGCEEILTKKPVEPGKHGTAKIELINTWMNSIEDGYMTLCFECWWGGTGTTHTISLVKTADPHHFLLRHNDAGDVAAYRNAGLIAFDLHEMPVPKGTEFDVLLEYEGYSVKKIVKFHYKDGKYSAPTRVDTEGYLLSDVE